MYDESVMYASARAVVLAVVIGLVPVLGEAPAGGHMPLRLLPDGYHLEKARTREHRLTNATLRLHARTFAQGEIIYLELIPDSAALFPVRAPVCRYGYYVVRVSRREWGYRGFVPIDPDTKPGRVQLTVEYPLSDTVLEHILEESVTATPFRVSRQALKVGKFANVNHARDPAVQRFIAECSAKKKKAFAHFGRDLVTARLAHPRDQHVITSPYWSSRVYERYRIENGQRIPLAPERKVHRGLDLRGARGDPIFAVADGLVVLADSTYYEGNFTVIDHGNRMMSYYMHQDSLLVTAGQTVQAGQQIGTVGATGVSTGPHLHVSLMIDRIQVDPLSLLPLPVRD